MPSKNKYTLEDYNMLAYDFAMRNQSVIKLIKGKLTNEVVNELKLYGIDATAFTYKYGGQNINSIQELYLNYEHFNDLNHKPYLSQYNEGEIEYFDGCKKMVHPFSKQKSYKKESDIVALNRIQGLIETRGNKLNRLMNGEAFKAYDEIILQGKTKYAFDNTNNNKGIDKDLKLIQEWSKKEKYLQLLPSYENIFKSLFSDNNLQSF